MKELTFIVQANEENSSEKIISLLTCSGDITYVTGGRDSCLIEFRTNKEIYEKVFKTKIEVNERGRNIYYSPGGYRELKKTTIPDSLSGLVSVIYLKKNKGNRRAGLFYMGRPRSETV